MTDKTIWICADPEYMRPVVDCEEEALHCIAEDVMWAYINSAMRMCDELHLNCYLHLGSPSHPPGGSLHDGWLLIGGVIADASLEDEIAQIHEAGAEAAKERRKQAIQERIGHLDNLLHEGMGCGSEEDEISELREIEGR